MNAPLPSELKLEQLSVAERLELLEAVWASLDHVADVDLPLSEAQKAEIDARIDALESGASVGTPWVEARARILRRP